MINQLLPNTVARFIGILACGLVGSSLLFAQTPSRPVSNSDESKTPAKDTKSVSETEQVERLLAGRKQYQSSLENLRLYYLRINDLEKARWVEDELKQYHRMVKYAYSLQLDLPNTTLQPRENIPEANDLYRRAMTYKDRGVGQDFIDNQRRMELLLQNLLDKYPTSDKIADAAFQLGDVYERYRPTPQFKRAIGYYERAFQWSKVGMAEARLRAARIYDRDLNDREKAVQMYRDVISHDTDAARIQEAERRLADLTGSRR
jgi:tetratricopeptide (TPR) repeat protein